ncbi:MAG TPA: sensor domain-containing protein [Solirubrobacteraceae bacterium]|nr:sensor domain-containing protein [Solirubrobacteraceae bacterium]
MTSATATQPAAPAPAPSGGPGARRRLGAQIARDTLYLVLSLPMGVLAFSLVVAGWSTAISSLVTLIGIPVALLTIFVTRGIAWVERARARIVTGQPVPGSYRTTLPLHLDDWRQGRGTWERIKAVVLDPQTWRDTGYELLLLPLGVVGFTVAVAGWSASLGLITAPLWWWIPHGTGPVHVGGYHVNGWAAAAVAALLGVLLVVVTAALVRGLSAASLGLVRWLLGCDVQQLEQRVEHLAQTRAGAVDAAQAELERIERDLHDGAQARLVAVAMDLGLAEQRIAEGEDPAAAAGLVREAREETQRALAELRDIARGIRPAMLAERGLEPALTSLAARVGGVPTSVTVDVGERLPTPVETAAYFVVAEALTNISKHAGASVASVRVQRRGPRLEIDIHDDGRGGANPNGTGIDGLRKRVEALDGTLALTSPPGGPTDLHVEIPCVS